MKQFVILILTTLILLSIPAPTNAHPHGQEYGKLVDETTVLILKQFALQTRSAIAKDAYPFQSHELKITDPEIMLKYDLFSPKQDTHKKDDEKSHPLIIVLEKLNRRAIQRKIEFDDLSTGLFRLPKTQKANPAYILRVKLGNEIEWEAYDGRASLNKLLKHLQSNHRIDSNRIYLIGLSDGAKVAWQWALRKPNAFAAIVTVGAGIVPRTKECEKLSHMPIRFYHGSDDRCVPVLFSRQTFAEFVLSDGKGWFYEYVGVRHNAWRLAMTDPLLIEWLFEQDKSTPVNYPLKDPVAATQRSSTQPASTQPTTQPSTQPATSQPTSTQPHVPTTQPIALP